MKNILLENMRRFRTKNLNETAMAFDGETLSKHPYFDQTIVVTIDGEQMELLFSNKPYDLKSASQLRLKEKAEFPSRDQIDALNALLLPGSNVGAIWVRQSATTDMENLDMRFILMDLSTKSDVQSSDDKSEALVLLRPADADVIGYANKKG